MTALEDSEIIALFYERSEQAIAELDRKYGAAVRKTAANILNDRRMEQRPAAESAAAEELRLPHRPEPGRQAVSRQHRAKEKRRL